MFSLIFSFLIFCQNSSAQNGVSVVIHGQTTLENEIIRLNDIAKISGNAAKAERLGQISLGYAPNIGMTREIPVRKINLAIAAAGFAKNEVSLKSPPSIHIKRASRKIDQIQIKETIEKEILEQFKNSKVSAKILRTDVPEFIDVPVGDIEITTEISKVRNLFSPFSLPIVIRINNEVYKRISANVEIEALAEVFVASRDLVKNTRISETDVRLEKVKLERPVHEYLYETENLRGIKVIRDLPGGAVLTRNSFVPDIVIKSGDMVRIVGQSGKIQVVVTGQARASGRIGDRITVKNLQSNQIIQAEIFDEGLVKVFF